MRTAFFYQRIKLLKKHERIKMDIKLYNSKIATKSMKYYSYS